MAKTESPIIITRLIPDRLGRKFKRHLKKCCVCGEYFLCPKSLLGKRKYCSHKCGASVYGKINGSRKRDKVRVRNKDPKFREKVARGVKKYHKDNPVKEQQWFIDIYGENYQPKSKYYIPGGDWRKTSKYLISRYPCHRCNTTKKLNVHHIIPYSITQDNSIYNLVVLCKSCHRIVEANNIGINNLLGGNWEVTRTLYKTFAEDKMNGIFYE